MTPANLAKLKQNLQSERDAFDKLVKTPNTLERNIALSTHRQEIARIEKLLQKAEREAPYTSGSRNS